jgi:hypothetical protein
MISIIKSHRRCRCPRRRPSHRRSHYCQSPSLSPSYPVALSPVASTSSCPLRLAIIVLESIWGHAHPILVWGSPSPNQYGDAHCKNPRTDSGIPEPIRGSPNQNGDPQTKTEIPKAKWGCTENESPNRFGDPQTKTGIPESSYQNGDHRTKSKNPHTKTGIPESVWGLFSH